MKISTKSLFKSLVSMMLALCMIFTYAPTIALAAEGESTAKPIVYVSLGDSMTNGYCLEGYDGTSGAVNYANETYSNKFAAYLAGLPEDYEIKNDQVIFKGTRVVDHRQLALSGMRAQDIQWVLELDYENDALMEAVFESDYIDSRTWDFDTWYDTDSWGFNGDYRTWADFCDYDFRYSDAAARILHMYHDETKPSYGYFTSSYATDAYVNAAIAGIEANPYYPEGKDQVDQIGGYKFLQIATEFYQKSIEDADIISIAVGNTNFGTHMLSSILDVVMYGKFFDHNGYNLEKVKEIAYGGDNATERTERQEYVKSKVDTILESQSYTEMVAMCKSLASGNAEKEDEIAYIVEYCMIAYINGYIGMLEAILEVNPDVEIVQIPLMNAYEEVGGTVKDGTLGELAEVIYKPVNELLESLLPDYIEKYKEAKFYLSEDVYVSCMVDVFGDDFYKDANGNFVTYPGPLDGTEGYTANTESIVRDRFVEEIVCGSLLFNAMGMQKLNSQENIKNFLYGGKVLNTNGSEAYTGCGAVNYDLMTYTQKAAYAAQNADAAKEYAIYLAFENALILSGTENVTMAALANLSNIATIFGDFYPYVLAAINNASPNYFVHAAPVVAAGSNGQLDTDDVMNIMNAYQTGGNDGAGMAAYGIAAEKANAMISNLMGGDSSISITLTGTDMYTLYKAPDFSAAVYDFIAGKSGGQLTSDQVGTLVDSEDGVFTVAAEIINKSYISASLIKAMYQSGDLSDEQASQLDLLFKVRNGALAFIGYEQTLKTSVGTLLASLPTIIESTSTLAYLLAIPDTMSITLYENEHMQGGLCMNARCLLGTGAGGHPSIGGHQALYNAMLGTFNQSITYEWSEDYSECTASRGEYATETVASTSKVAVEPGCETKGKTTYTAAFEIYWAAPQTVTVEDIPENGHSYESVVTEPTCTEDGYTTYTCGACGNSYVDDVVTAPGHIYGEDGKCVCGRRDPSILPACEYIVGESLSSGGTYILGLNGKHVGSYTFTQTSGGWTITDANGKFLKVDDNGNLVTSDSAFNWTYENNHFSASVGNGPSNWLQALLGTGNKKTTYYLVASGESVAASTTAATATFHSKATADEHDFTDTIHAPTCTEEGYTSYTCSKCGYTGIAAIKPELGHNYSEKTVAPTCDNKGYVEHTCSRCGNVYKDNEVSPLGHNIVDGTCQNCGQPDFVVYGECTYRTDASLSNGTYYMTLGGNEVGTYTFTSVNGGWAIKDASGKYLSVDNSGNLVRSDSAFAWTYSNGQFSASVGSSSTNWLQALLGTGSKKTTYYLAPSGNNVTASTVGVQASFYSESKEQYHDFKDTVVAPSCGKDGYTEHTCSRCGYSYANNYTPALAHNYSHAFVEATCTADGGDVYTCVTCGHSYIENKITQLGHKFGEDGLCERCGAPDEPECVHKVDQALSSGSSYELNLGGNSVGTYTYIAVNGGWAIKNANGKYLAVNDSGALVLSDSAYAWTYSNGQFSASVGKGASNWLQALLGTGGKKTTYYLVSSGNNIAVSTSNSLAAARFLVDAVGGEHAYGTVRPANGNHNYICANCGYVKSVACNDANCAICTAKVNVSVNVTKSSGGSWLAILLGTAKNNSTATITTSASGTSVTAVEYSTNGTNWTAGTSFTSSSDINSFRIRVTASNGVVYMYSYNNGTVTLI